LFLVILLLMNWGRFFPPESSVDCFSRERLLALNASGVRLLVVEGNVYDISGWINTSYPSGDFLLESELSADEAADLSAPLGVLCTGELEDVNYSATIGVTDGTKDIVARLVNKTVETLKEDYKMTANEDKVAYMGWHIRSKIVLKETADFCTEGVDLIFSESPPDAEKLEGCGRRAFAAGGGNVSRVYIIRSAVSNTFFEPLLLEFNGLPGYGLLERYTG